MAAMKKQEKEQSKQENNSVLKDKIKYLEEEVIRKQEEIDKLKKENLVLFKTALKHSEEKFEEKKKAKK